MPAKKEPFYQHITSAERVIIQDRLDHNQSFNNIAIELERSPSTISREVLRHRIREPKQKSLCASRKTCKVKALCKNCISKYRDSCRKCPQCKKFCPDFRPGIERSISGGKRTSVYYCETNRSDEKAGCEKNHTLIRYVIPKGTSLERFTQKDVSLMIDHINSYKRRSLGGNSPYEVARFWHVPEDFFILLGLEDIPPEKVNLTPSLPK